MLGVGVSRCRKQTPKALLLAVFLSIDVPTGYVTFVVSTGDLGCRNSLWVATAKTANICDPHTYQGNAEGPDVVVAEEKKPLMAAERRERTIELVAQHGAVRVSELSELFQVSEVTIRNDLELLSKQGILVRDRGGAIANPQRHLTVAFVKRASLNLDQKRRIGLAAAHLVKPGDTIIMDAGTTLMEMAKNLRNDLSVTVVTNALNIATHVGTLPDAHVILLGGSLLRGTISTAGPVTECALNDLSVQKAFLGIHAIDEEFGLSDTTLEVARVKRGMVKAARQVILLVDSSKWDQVAFTKVIPLSDVDIIITNSDLPKAAQKTIKDLGIELILV